MTSKGKKAQLTPEIILDDLRAAWKSQVLVTAVELDIFSHIAAKNRTVKEIAKAASASQRGIANLLDSLTALHYLRKSGSRYSLTPVSAAFLVRGKKSYIGASTLPFSLNRDIWNHLTEVVKTGKPYHAVNVAEKGKEFFPKLVAGIFPGNFAASTAFVAQLSSKERHRIRKILDVAAGSGAWSLAFAQAIPEAHVTTIDFPELTPITREFAQKFGVDGRYQYQEGDLRQVEFGQNVYDLIILGHIFHSEGEKHGRALLAKSYAALRSGGKLLIAEFVPNDGRTGPPMAVMFGLNMLLNTEEGNVFTFREYRGWLKAAGFRTAKMISLKSPSTLLLATK